MASCNHASSDIDLMASSISSISGGGGSGKPVCILHVNILLIEKEQYYRNDNLTLKFILINKESHDINKIELSAELNDGFLNLTDQSDNRSLYLHCPRLPANSNKIFPFKIRISRKAKPGSSKMILVPGSLKIDFKEKYSAPEIDGIQKPILITNRIPMITSSRVNILSPCVPSDRELFVLENNKIIKFSLFVRANDDDGDRITYRWIIPETGKVMEETKEDSDNLTLNLTNSIIGKNISFMVSANDGMDYSENNSSILSYEGYQYDNIIVPGNDYYRSVGVILIILISIILILYNIILNRCQVAGWLKKYHNYIYTKRIKKVVSLKSKIKSILSSLSGLLISVLNLNPVVGWLKKYYNDIYTERLKKVVSLNSKIESIHRSLSGLVNILLNLIKFPIAPLSIIVSYYYLYRVGFLKIQDMSVSKFLNIGFPILFNSTYFLEITIFLIVFYCIACINQNSFSPKCNDIPGRLWLYNSIFMAILLLSLCVIIPQIDDSKMPDHLHYYYSSMTQVFATIIAIVAATSLNAKSFNHDGIKRFMVLNVSIVLLSFLGLSAFVYNAKFSPILESLDILNWAPILVFETTLLMIPAAIFSLYEFLISKDIDSENKPLQK
jgi:hypothetical protein